LVFDHGLKYNGALRAVQTFFCIALLLLAPFFLKSQNDVKKDSTLLAEATDLFDKKQYSEAIELANSAAMGFIEKANWRSVIDCQTILVSIEYLDVFSKSLLPDIEYIHSMIPDSSDMDKAISFYNIALLADEKGNTIKAFKNYQASIEPFKEHKDSIYLSWAYFNVGSIYTVFGDYSRARKYLDASAEIMLETGDIYGSWDCIYNLAENAFYEGDFQESENLYRKYQGLIPDNKEEIYFPLCEIKIAKMELDSARLYLNLARKWKNKFGTTTASLNSLNAEILCAEGNLGGAIAQMIKSESEMEEMENVRDKGRYFWKLADLYSMKKDWGRAEFYYNKSLKAFSNDEISIDSISAFRQKNYLFHEIWFGDVLIGLSNVYKEKHRLNNGKGFKDKSKECLEFALESLDFKRSVFEDISSSIKLNKKSKSLYEQAINIYLDWYRESGLESELDKAFQLAQRHNAFVLRQQINERTKLDRFGVDDTLKVEYLNLRLQIVEASSELEKKYTKDGFKNLKSKESKLDSIEQLLAIKHPQFAAAKNDFSVATIQDIQKSLSKDRAVIKYFEGEKNLYSFAITKNNIRHFVHPDVGKISADIKTLRSILSDFNNEQLREDSIEQSFLKIAHKLGMSIIAQELESLPKTINKITIVPTGSLTQIPFETLIIREKNSWEDPNQYLINDYAISYNYFCKALTSPTISKALEKVLSYGLEYDEYTLNASKKISNDSFSTQIIEKFRSEEMGHLHFADDEALEVANMFDGTSYINEDATKLNFLSNVQEYDIVHLSAHSFVDYQYPSNSAIIFSKKDSLTDNLLRIKDVDRLTLDGQFFTLSACNTFFGKKNEGEGLSSIARSFIQSGAGSVVGSFWSVSDEISKSFMVEFYKKMKQGQPKDEALRATKIDFMTDDNLSSPLYRSPAYWSAWVIYGDTKSIYHSTDKLIYLGIGLLCFIILLLVKLRNW